MPIPFHDLPLGQFVFTYSVFAVALGGGVKGWYDRRLRRQARTPAPPQA